MSHTKLLQHLREQNTIELFYEKCSNYISDELKKHIIKSPKESNFSDGAETNYFEEMKISLLSKAIKRYKPFFYTL